MESVRNFFQFLTNSSDVVNWWNELHITSRFRCNTHPLTSLTVLGGLKHLSICPIQVLQKTHKWCPYYQAMKTKVRVSAAALLDDGVYIQPRQVPRQRNRVKMESCSDQEYFKRGIYYPAFLDHILSELRSRFNKHSRIITHLHVVTHSKISS